MRYREWVLRELERKGKKPPGPPAALDWERVRADFRGVQLESKALRPAASGVAPDLKAVEKSAAEVHRRALRLDAELLLPAEEGGAAAAGQSRDVSGLSLVTLASALDGVVRRFVTNPVFDETVVLDVRQAYKAKHDLDRVVALSRELKRRARDAARR